MDIVSTISSYPNGWQQYISYKLVCPIQQLSRRKNHDNLTYTIRCDKSHEIINRFN
jgi:hypothetical protein